MIVVSDTSPLNYLVLTGYANVLPRLYGGIVIPQAVREELTHADAPPLVREWMLSCPDWVDVQDAPVPLPDQPLDRGEHEAIALAGSLGADLLLLDELKGRAAASERGLRVVGTLGVLAQAAAAGLVSLPEAVDKLRRTSYRIGERLVAAVLEHDRQSRPDALGTQGPADSTAI